MKYFNFLKIFFIFIFSFFVLIVEGSNRSAPNPTGGFRRTTYKEGDYKEPFDDDYQRTCNSYNQAPVSSPLSEGFIVTILGGLSLGVLKIIKSNRESA